MSQLSSIGLGELLIIGLFLSASSALIAGGTAAFLVLRERRGNN